MPHARTPLAVLLLSFLLVGTSLAQTRPNRSGQARFAGTIQGVIVADDTSDPIASATIAVWRDSTLVTGAVTQGDGSFAIEGLRPGVYDVKASFVGFTTAVAEDVRVGPRAPTADVGTIRLAPDTQALDEVEVTAEREFVQVGVDRTVYNTKDQLVSAGGNASDVLGNLPSIEVDIDGNISLRGNQNVAVLINGKPAPMQGEALVSFLQGLPADAIDRVEVIPNPSAKYEPDGMAGILNIVLAQDRDLGLSGSATLAAETQDTYNASGTVNYQKGRVGLSATYGFRTGARNIEGARFRENRYATPLTFLDQDSFDERDRLSHTFNTTFDYQLSKLNSLSVSALLSRRSSDATGLTAYTELDAAEAATAWYDRRTTGEGTDFSMDYRLRYARTVEPGTNELTVEARYEQGWEDEFDRFMQQVFVSETDATGSVVEEQINDQDEREQEVTLQADYVRPIGETRLEAGYQGSLSRTENDLLSQTFDPAEDRFITDADNAFAFDEQIHAAYGILAGEVGRFGLQAGVRLEQALTTFDLSTTGESFDNNYFSIFPSAFATYKLTETRSLKVSYSKRIRRPRTWQLNPLDENDDPLFRRIGNPYLSPEYVHAFEGSFTQFSKGTSLTLTPYFRRTVDVIRWFERLNDDGVSILTFENLDTSDSWGAEVIGTFRLGRWLSGFASINGYKVVTDGSNVDSDLSNDALGFSTRVNATVNVRPDLAVQFSHFYSSPRDIENGRIDSHSMADLAVRQEFLNDRASLSLRVRDVFGTMGFSLQREDERFFQTFERDWDAQRIGLTFSYRFGQTDDRRRDRGDRGDRGDMGGGEEMAF